MATSTSKVNTPTSASAWSSTRREGTLIELPSGNFAKIRRAMDLAMMLKTGQIPNPLAEIVNGMIRTQSAAFPAEKMDEQAVAQMLDLIDQTCVKVFVEPKVEIPPEDVDRGDFEPSEGAISIDDIDMQDRFFVFGFVQGGPSDLAQFRAQQSEAAATAQDGNGVQPEAK